MMITTFRGRGLKQRRERIRELIRDKMYHLHDEDDLSFITRDDLEGIWATSNTLQEMRVNLHITQEEEEFKSDFLLILSILIWIKWDDWKSFKQKFVDSLGRKDENLPFGKLILMDENFLFAEAGQNFFREQYPFLPVTIVQGAGLGNEQVPSKWSQRHRLPFTQIQEIFAKGHSGTVTKQLVAGKYIRTADGRDFSQETRGKPMIVKRVDPQYFVEFKSERNVMKQIRACIRENHNISLSFAAIEQGNALYIISEPANCNLSDLLHGSFEGFNQLQQQFTPEALIRETWSIAQALEFLHTGLSNKDADFICYHMDLKPENILVILERGSPVGRWQITDFGISKVKTPRRNEGPFSVAEEFLSLHKLRKRARNKEPLITPGQGPAVYQAPEVQSTERRTYSTASDVWSLGCILADILGFVIGGPTEIGKLREARNHDESQHNYFYGSYENSTELKTEVRDWLRSHKNSSVWAHSWCALIFQVLNPVPSTRPEAGHVCDELRNITNEIARTSPQPTCAWTQSHRQSQSMVYTEVPTLNSTSSMSIEPFQPFMLSSDRGEKWFRISELDLKPRKVLLSDQGNRMVCFSEKTTYLLELGLLDERIPWQSGAPKSSSGLLNLSASQMKEIPFCSEKDACSLAYPFWAKLEFDNTQCQHTASLFNIEGGPCPTPQKPPPIKLDMGSPTIVVSCRGDLVVYSDEYLFFQSLSRPGPWHKFPANGYLIKATFSHNGKFIFIWSCLQDSWEDSWSIFDAETCKGCAPLHFSSTSSSNSRGSSENIIMPHPTQPCFATLDRFGVFSIIGAVAGRLYRTNCHGLLDGYVSGAITPNGNAILLLRQPQGQVHPEFLIIHIPSSIGITNREAEVLPIHDTKFCKRFNPKSCTLAMYGGLSKTELFVSYPNGLTQKLQLSKDQ